MRLVAKYGVLLALAIMLWTLIVHLLGFYTVRIQYAAAVDQVALIIPVAILTKALLEERRRRAGRLPFLTGVLTGMAVAAISAPFTVIGLWAYHHFVNPEWLSYLIGHKQQELVAAGMSPDLIAPVIDQLRQSGGDRQQVVGGLVGSVVMGLVLSFLITLAVWLYDRRRQTFPGK
jgi:hypothetical protein